MALPYVCLETMLVPRILRQGWISSLPKVARSNGSSRVVGLCSPPVRYTTTVQRPVRWYLRHRRPNDVRTSPTDWNFRARVRRRPVGWYPRPYSTKNSPPPPPPATIIDWHLPRQDTFDHGDPPPTVLEPIDPQSQPFLPIKAYFIGTEIDIVKLYQAAIGGPDKYTLRKDTVVASFDDGEGYAFFFEYGAVVFFRLDLATQKSCLQSARSYSSTLVHNPESEELFFREDPRMSRVHALDDGRLILRNADAATVRVVAGILGQSVALDHHEREVDALLDMFNSLNGNIESTGEMDMKSEDLYRLVAKNNRILSDVIAKFNVMDQARPAGETALWNVPDHYSLWDRLRDEFEIKTRFGSMEYKLELIRENTKFFVDVLAHKQGTRLELAIIVLIFMELVIAASDHLDAAVIQAWLPSIK
eukprot:g13139.t1